MVKVYNTAGWINGDFEVIGRRADQPYPKAYLLRTCKDALGGTDYYVGHFCAERQTGSYEHLEASDTMPAYRTREEAIAAARAQGFAA